MAEAQEPGECGEVHMPEGYQWDPVRWEDGGPVMVCIEHGALAPGWVYDVTMSKVAGVLYQLPEDFFMEFGPAAKDAP